MDQHTTASPSSWKDKDNGADVESQAHRPQAFDKAHLLVLYPKVLHVVASLKLFSLAKFNLIQSLRRSLKMRLPCRLMTSCHAQILDEQLLEHKKHGSHKGILPQPRHLLHRHLLRDFCEQALRKSSRALKSLRKQSSLGHKQEQKQKRAVGDAQAEAVTYETCMGAIRQLVVAGALCLSEHLGSRANTQHACTGARSSTPLMTAGGKRGAHGLRATPEHRVASCREEEDKQEGEEEPLGWPELSYEASKHAQVMCSKLKKWLEEEAERCVGGELVASVNKCGAAAANNLACLFIGAGKPHAALYHLEMCMRYEGEADKVEDAAGMLSPLKSILILSGLQYHTLHTPTQQCVPTFCLRHAGAGTHFNAAAYVVTTRWMVLVHPLDFGLIKPTTTVCGMRVQGRI